MFDYHIHTAFSFDCNASMSEYCARARQREIKAICFCEHVEPRHPYKIDWDGFIDYEEYSRNIDRLREHCPDLFIGKGLETGLCTENINDIAAFQQGKDLDFVIASQHVVHGRDPYDDKDFFTGKPVEETLRDYLLYMYECLRAFDDYDAIGHIGYPGKFAQPPVALRYEGELRDALDEVLRLNAERGKALEINTTGFYTFDEPLPTLSVLRRFRELGGERLTVGSDAHFTMVLGHEFNRAVEFAAAAGFRYLCTYRARQAEFVKI